MADPKRNFVPSYLGRTNYFLNELGVAIIFPNVRGSDADTPRRPHAHM